MRKRGKWRMRRRIKAEEKMEKKMEPENKRGGGR